jgi:hypothetical protein
MNTNVLPNDWAGYEAIASVENYHNQCLGMRTRMIDDGGPHTSWNLY